MIVSLKLLKEYLPGIEINSVDGLIEDMISIGLDIESITNQKEIYNNFIIAEIIEVNIHPGAENLKLCKVNTGEEIINVVCGAPNVVPGVKVCLALDGAVIPKDNSIVKKTTIKQEISEGMLCSEDELLLSDDNSGILILGDDAKIGTPLAEHFELDDYVFDIGITPNRGDLFSHFGIAREIGALYNVKCKYPELKLKESNELTSDYIKITIQNENLCRRFTGRIVKNVKITQSPKWLKRRLLSVGLRPINNIVDITNFVMYESGQPLHAFDYDKITSKHIIVRTANQGDKFVTLDSKERVLNSESLMVCDGDKYSAIAGIMGGEFSEITPYTIDVFIESAYFDPVSVRKNSKRLGLQTDASQRFERGVDIENVAYASNRAANLMQDIAGGIVTKGMVDNYPVKFEKNKVSLRVSKTNRVLGSDLTVKNIIELLGKIEFKKVSEKGDVIVFDVPEFRRNDVEREIDLIEEIARLNGYTKLTDKYDFKINLSEHTDYDIKKINYINSLREYFIGRGFNETITYTQQFSEKISRFTEDIVYIDNPNTVEMNVMRVNLLYGLMNVITENYKKSGKDISLKLFEIGKVFNKENSKIIEKNNFSFALTGFYDSKFFNETEGYYDYADAIGELEMLFSKFHIPSQKLEMIRENFFSDVCFDLIISGNKIGRLYLINENVENLFEIFNSVFLFEFDLEKFINSTEENIKFKEISKYPVVKRDIALIVDKNITNKQIMDTLNNCNINDLKKIFLFDVYEDEKLGQDKKSMAYSLEFLSDRKTLSDEEVNEYFDILVENLYKKLGITLRI